MYGRLYHQLNNLGIILRGVPIKKERRIVTVIKMGGTMNKQNTSFTISASMQLGGPKNKYISDSEIIVIPILPKNEIVEVSVFNLLNKYCEIQS